MTQQTKKDKIYEYDGQAVFPCRSCGTEIFFVKTETGKKMPVNRETLKSHFIDCPEAKKWRRGKR